MKENGYTENDFPYPLNKEYYLEELINKLGENKDTNSPLWKYWATNYRANFFENYSFPEMPVLTNYKYSEDSTVGDMIVTDIRPANDLNYDNVFYPSGETMSQKTDNKDVFINKVFLSDNACNLDGVFEGKDLNSLGNSNITSIDTISAIHMSNLIETDVLKYKNDKVLFKTIILRDKNLLGFLPSMSIMVNYSKDMPYVTYEEYEIEKNIIAYHSFDSYTWLI